MQLVMKVQPQHKLTPREREILVLLCQGQTTKDVAESLKISIYTVDSHRKNLAAKLNAHTGVEMGALAIIQGHLNDEEISNLKRKMYEPKLKHIEQE